MKFHFQITIYYFELVALLITSRIHLQKEILPRIVSLRPITLMAVPSEDKRD